MLLRIRPLYFFAALAVGLLFTYLLAPQPTVVVKFPTPFNAGKVVYRDATEGCFKFNAAKVPCPADGTDVVPQPIAGGADALLGASPL